jgi:glucuronoarabinoxylan endo-1,4-beta-xylanase
MGKFLFHLVKLHLKFPVLTLLLSAVVWSTQAASINWVSVGNITSDDDISASGTLLYAEDWSAATAVNGVAFAYDNSKTGDANVGVAFSGSGGVSTSVFGGPGNAPYSTLSSQYQTLVKGGVYGGTSVPGGTSTGTITLKGLTAGKGYQVQIWISDSRSGAAGGTNSYPTRVTTLSSPGGTSVNLAHNVGGTSTSPTGGLGQYAIGAFVADATTQVINVTASNTVSTGTGGTQLSAISVASFVVTGSATVNYNSTKQRIDGFGASSAWDSSWTTAQADLFFSTNSGGVGLSLLRSRIAPDGSSVETSIMQMAQARGARVWSSPWSPPASDKTSGSVNGGSFISNAGNYQSYANQLAAYVATMKNGYGVNVTAVSVQNEPDVSQTYESCLWTAAQIHDFVPYFYNALASAGVASTAIILPESEAWGFSLATNTMNDPATAGMVGILAGHNYGSSPAAVTQFGTPTPRPLWETEHYFGSGAGMQNGLAVAQEIHSFLTVAQANAYHYWWLRGSGNGSISGDSTNPPAKRLYVLGNYSKFVRPGFYRVDAANSTAALLSAYKDPASSNYVIVAANPAAVPVTQTFNVASCPSFPSLNPWVTSATLSLSQQAPVNVTGGSFTYTLPAWSVVTFTSAPAPTPLIVLTGSDAFMQSSFNAEGNWDDAYAPGASSDYTAAQYGVRTPFLAGDTAFAGHSLTLPPLGNLSYNGVDGCTLTVPSLILAGGAVNISYPSSYFTLAGNINVSADSIINPGSDATHTITVAANLFGSSKLSNGNGGPGTVSYTGANSAFTGALYVNGGTILQAGSQANLGGNPAAFNAGQLTLDKAVFQPTASFTIANSNSGITLGAGGATFDVEGSLILTVQNPVAGPGNLIKSGSGTLVLSGANSYSGTTLVAGGILILNGLSSSGGVTVASGTIAGSTTLSGTLAPTTGGLTFSGPVSFGAGLHLQWSLGANSAGAGSGPLKVTTANLTTGAVVDVVLNSSGSATDFSNSFWKTAQTWPVLTAPSVAGTFTLGSLSADILGRSASWFGAFSIVQNATTVNLVWTPAPPWQQWRAVNFGANWNNAAVSGANVVTAGDGLTNLVKYAFDLPAAAPAAVPATLSPSAGVWTYTYQRPANRPDLTYNVEVCTSLTTSAWTTSGVTQSLVTSGDPQTWQASFTPGNQSQVFFRLKIVQQ